MLKFLSKVRIEFNALDPRTAACMEFLAQCNARKAKESNPGCQLQVKRRTDDHPPQITVTFVNGIEEVFDATSTSAQSIRQMILDKGQMLETEQMFKDNGESWPVVIPAEELHQSFPGTKVSVEQLELGEPASTGMERILPDLRAVMVPLPGKKTSDFIGSSEYPLCLPLLLTPAFHWPLGPA